MTAPTFLFKGREVEGYKFSYSRVASYLSCPQKHYFGYVEKIKPKGVVRPLFFGGDFHSLLENRHDPVALKKVREEIQETYNSLTPSQMSDIGDSYLEELEIVFGDYLEVWEDEELPVETEFEFIVPIAKYKGYPVYFHGKVDELYEDGTIGEHKTFNQRPDMSLLAMNMQVCLYAKAVELTKGIKPRRVRWDYIKSTPADKPIWLPKSNRFSEAQNSKITHLSWRRACDERGIEDPEICSKAEQYAKNISNFYFRVGIEIVPEMVETVWGDFKKVIKDIVTKGDEYKIKNITRDCSWCNYRPLCYAEFTGADVGYVKKTDFIQKES